MKKAEIFYFDVDGTLLDNQTHTIPDSTVKSLHALKALGYKIALCTGRTLLGAQELGILDMFEWDGFVLANGAAVYDKNLKVLRELKFDPAWIHQLLAVHDGPLLLEGDTMMFTATANEQLLKALKHFHMDTHYPIHTYSNENVYNIMAYAFDTIPKNVQASLFKGLDIVYDQLGNREIMPLGGGKDEGVKILNKHLNVTYYVGFGDGHNDVKFLTKADFSVAMGNGCEAVKSVANYITDTVANDGIYQALRHFNVIEEII